MGLNAVVFNSCPSKSDVQAELIRTSELGQRLASYGQGPNLAYCLFCRTQELRKVSILSSG